MRPILKSSKIVQNFFLSQNNQLWAYGNYLKWLGNSRMYSLCNFLELCRLKVNERRKK